MRAVPVKKDVWAMSATDNPRPCCPVREEILNKLIGFAAPADFMPKDFLHISQFLRTGDKVANPGGDGRIIKDINIK